MNRIAPFGWTALGGGILASALWASGNLPVQTEQAPIAQADTTGEAPTSEGLALTPADQARAGIQVAALTASSVAAERRGFARTLDPGALAAIDSEAQSAQAAVRTSAAEASRLRALYLADQSASRRSLEAAQAQAASDSIRLNLALRRVGLEYGGGLMRLGPGGVGSLLSEIANERAALVRIDIPGVVLRRGDTVRVGDPGNEVIARILGSAAAADAKLQTAGALAVVRGPLAAALAPGRIVPANIAGGKIQSGVLVPRAAIIRWQGARWVYRQGDKGFDRIEVIDGEPVGDGWLVTQGLAVGDKVAVAGAGSLLAIERGGEAAE